MVNTCRDGGYGIIKWPQIRNTPCGGEMDGEGVLDAAGGDQAMNEIKSGGT